MDLSAKSFKEAEHTKDLAMAAKEAALDALDRAEALIKWSLACTPDQNDTCMAKGTT